MPMITVYVSQEAHDELEAVSRETGRAIDDLASCLIDDPMERAGWERRERERHASARNQKEMNLA